MGTNIPISSKNIIKTNCTLLKDRKLIKKSDTKEYIYYLINIKIDEKEIILSLLLNIYLFMNYQH